jgi:hypothetical protein
VVELNCESTNGVCIECKHQLKIELDANMASFFAPLGRLIDVRPTMRKSKRNMVLLVVALAAPLLVYCFGIIFEFEYPYWLTIRRAALASGPSGEKVSVMVDEVLRKDTPRHWHTCGYCIHAFTNSSVCRIRLDADVTPTWRVSYYFVFDPKSGIIAPSDDYTSERFSALIYGRAWSNQAVERTRASARVAHF